MRLFVVAIMASTSLSAIISGNVFAKNETNKPKSKQSLWGDNHLIPPENILERQRLYRLIRLGAEIVSGPNGANGANGRLSRPIYSEGNAGTYCTSGFTSIAEYNPEGYDDVDIPGMQPGTPTWNAYQNFKKMGGNPLAFKQALCFINENHDSVFRSQGGRAGMKIKKNCRLSIQDNNNFGNDSQNNFKTGKIFHIDLCNDGEVKSSSTALGYGDVCQGPEQCSSGSGSSPHGFFILGGHHPGGSDKAWSNARGEKGGIKMHGLEPWNQNSFRPRYVVMHEALGWRNGPGSERFKYIQDGVNSSSQGGGASYQTVNGRSAGCTTLNQEMFQSYREHMGTEPGSDPGEGTLHYSFSAFEEAQGEQYCGKGIKN